MGKLLLRQLRPILRGCPGIFPPGAGPDQVFHAGQWLYFEDADGPGHAQPDIYLVCSDRVVVFEVKLTRHPQAEDQLTKLYWPLLEELYELPPVGVEVFRNPGAGYVPHPDRPRHLLDALRLPPRSLSEWHVLI